MKMRFCTYCGSMLDENTGVCPKCFGGIDAPKQEGQAADLTAVPKVDLGDSPFASAPSSIPTLTLDPFGNSAVSGEGSGIQLNFGDTSPREETPTPQLVMSGAPGGSETGSGITLSLEPNISLREPEATDTVKTEAAASNITAPEPTASTEAETSNVTETKTIPEAETTAEPPLGVPETGPLEFSEKKTTKFEEMVAKIQADQERIKQEHYAQTQQQSLQQQYRMAQQAHQPQAVPQQSLQEQYAQAQQAHQPQAVPQQSLQEQYAQAQQAHQPQAVPQQSLQEQYAQARQQGVMPMQAPQNSYSDPAPTPMAAPSYGQPRPNMPGAQYAQPQAAQYTQAQTAQNAQYGQQAPMYGQQMPGQQGGSYGQPYGQPQNAQYGQQGAPYGQPQNAQYSQQGTMYGQPYNPAQNGAYSTSSMPAYGMQGDMAAAPETAREYMQRPASYANPAYVDQEVTYNTQYGQPVDPRFSQTVNMNMQYNPAQAPVLYQQQNLAYQQPGVPIASIENKNRVTAAILAIFLGNFGAHKFYLNHQSAIWYVLISVLSCGVAAPVVWIISLIEGIGYLGMSDEEFKQKLYEEFLKTQQ